MKFYFAHPVSDFGTQAEFEIFHEIESHLDAIYEDRLVFIENPNQQHHQDGYAVKGMDYYYEDMLPSCDGCVLVAFPGGMVGRGVYGEAEWFFSRGLPVYEYYVGADILVEVDSLTAIESRTLTREETRGATKVLKTLSNGGRV